MATLVNSGFDPAELVARLSVAPRGISADSRLVRPGEVFAALNVPATCAATSPLPHGVSTDMRIPACVLPTAVATMSALTSPYVSTFCRRPRAASARLWPNGSSTLITRVSSPGQMNRRDFAVPYAAIVPW